MADALVSVVLEQLSSIIIQEVQREVRLVVGVENEVKKLTSNFQAIQAVFADAEERQLKDQLVKHWLDQLKDVSYDMDDVLDEWGTEIAKSQSKVKEHPRKNTRKVCSFMIFSCFRFREVGLRRDIALKIKELNERIDGIAIEKNRFHFKSSEVVIKQHDHRKTVSFIDAAEVKGRETDKGRVRNMLLTESSQGPALRTISLVGMGGIGKTTLAQLVYNDHEVETHFDKRIWVCVSDPFDETKIAKAILEALKGSASDLIELQTLLENIQPLIRGKKFLLVLDDVWNEDSTKWEQLKYSLMCGLPGSSILVTTRKRNVASRMGSSPTDILELGLLSTDECWSLFSRLAFFEKNSRERGDLEDIGRQIAAKCKGLPLAAKSLGSLLRFKSRIEEWESVLNSHVWESAEEAESKILAPLWLSYYDLPSDMRRCFSYCAVFPKDFTFRRDTLVKLWMAQGFLRETHNKEMEVTGRQCFEALAARSFFQDFQKEAGDGSIYACKMHDMVHDLAQNLTKNECSSVDIDGPTELKIDSFSINARHSMVVFRNYETDLLPATIHSFKKLRSLIVDGDPSSMNAALPNLIANLSCLRTLKLSRCGIEEVPSNIGKLIHLRHVDLSWNKIRELPEEMCELYNMLTLDVSDCGKLERLPDNIGRLVKLRHLSVSNWQLVKMRGFEGLSSLRELDDFHVSGSDKESNIGDLRKLNHLQGSLTIRWLGDVKVPDEVKKAEMKSKKHLTRLGLFFESRTDREKINDGEVLEALEPMTPPNIDSLRIYYYKGVIPVFPTWINKLRVVVLFDWGKIENLPPLGKLPSLEELSVYRMECVGRVGRGFLGLGVDSDISIGEMTSSSSNTIIAFPKLKSLDFGFMEEWEEWEGGEGGNEDKTNISISTIIMPSLRYLEIRWCPKLKALPDYVLQSTTLEQLIIDDSPIIGAQFEEGGKGWPNASHTPNISIY
ncbi:hypothetical protein Peur_067608 [Populus x canadensis]